MQKKEQVIEKLKALLESDEEENKQDAVRELMREWNEIGFVPFKEKDKIYKAYHETVDQLFKALNMSAARRRLDNFKNNLKNDAKEGGQGLVPRTGTLGTGLRKQTQRNQDVRKQSGLPDLQFEEGQ